MIPAGFVAKKVHSSPDWLKADAVDDVYSVSNCVSRAFCDYIPHWRHNGYWLFDSPEVIREIASAEQLDLSSQKFFYYEVHDQQFDDELKNWQPFSADTSFATDVQVPAERKLEGYDVVSFYALSAPECSPLSCNHMAETIPVNAHCLLASFEDAKRLIETGAFKGCEPGPYRIFAVYSC
jgi:hypothetical protein